MAILKNLNTAQYLNEVHKTMLKNLKIKNNSTFAKETLQAQKLESFLEQIKYLQKNNFEIKSDYPFSKFWTKTEQLVLMEQLNAIHPEIFSRLGLVNTKYNSSYAIGDALENDLAAIIKGFKSYIEQTDYQQNYTSKIGSAKIQSINLDGAINDRIKKAFNDMYNDISINLKKYKDENTEIKRFSSMKEVNAKIDNVGLIGEFAIKVSGKMENDIADALTNATFTVKNYLSTNNIHFGQTNPFRVFSIVALENNPEQLLGRFCSILECFQNLHSHTPDTPTSFFRIRAIYELTGIGIKYSTNSMEKNNILKQIEGQYAKFLIWNTPWANIGQRSVHVIPTQKIVQQLIENSNNLLPNNWRDALYGPISIPQIDLANI